MVTHGILNEVHRKDKVTESKEETDRQGEREKREREKKNKRGKVIEIVPILSWKQGVPKFIQVRTQ